MGHCSTRRRGDEEEEEEEEEGRNKRTEIIGKAELRSRSRRVGRCDGCFLANLKQRLTKREQQSRHVNDVKTRMKQKKLLTLG